MSTEPTPVVCVDGDASALEATVDALEGADGLAVVAAVTSVAEFRDALADADAVDCVVTEYDLPDGTGLDVTNHLREVAPDAACILFTDAEPTDVDTTDYEGMVVEYMPKAMPDARASLVRLVANVVAQRSQVAYPLPDEEDERLAALEQYDLPELETVEAFDRIAGLAKRHFSVDVAFVGLVDAHAERFVACRGADWESLDRDDTICTHTLLADDVMVVEDVAADERFSGNDRLVELDIASYAGATLTTPAGAAIGAFCLVDDEPRSYSESERRDLRAFADEVMEQLELRRRLVEADGDGDTEGVSESP